MDSPVRCAVIGIGIGSSRNSGGEVETTTRMQIRSGACPECEAQVRLVGRLLVGEVVGCGACGAQLEVACPDPIVLEPLARVEVLEDEV